MKHWTRRLFALGAMLLLTGCLWSPGKFTSDLLIRKNGSFILDYRGEILLQRPEDKGESAAPWSDSMARCHDDGRTETLSTVVGETQVVEEPPPGEEGVRPCT
ncbi:MAG: hypothetical protein ACREB1_01410, partial [Sphingomicrobium sp.]